MSSTDPLPAGFEIENPDLTTAGGIGDLTWLSVDRPEHVESRTDLYMAAFDFTSGTPDFSTAYLVRAVSPGTFTLPGASGRGHVPARDARQHRAPVRSRSRRLGS